VHTEEEDNNRYRGKKREEKCSLGNPLINLRGGSQAFSTGAGAAGNFLKMYLDWALGRHVETKDYMG